MIGLNGWTFLFRNMKSNSREDMRPSYFQAFTCVVNGSEQLFSFVYKKWTWKSMQCQSFLTTCHRSWKGIADDVVKQFTTTITHLCKFTGFSRPNKPMPRNSFWQTKCRRPNFVEVTPGTCTIAGILQKRRSDSNTDVCWNNKIYTEKIPTENDAGIAGNNYAWITGNYARIMGNDVGWKNG